MRHGRKPLVGPPDVEVDLRTTDEHEMWELYVASYAPIEYNPCPFYGDDCAGCVACEVCHDED